MSPELDKKLCEDFPLLFARRHGNMMETAMCWGFECGDGWEPLIRRGAEKLEALIKALPAPPEGNHPHLPCASQIKEKYGTLRFYMHSETDEMSDICNRMELESEKTCEECGRPGKIRGKGWYYTACNDCHKERMKTP